MFIKIASADAALSKRIVGFPVSGRFEVAHLPALASSVDFIHPDASDAPAPRAPAALVDMLEQRLATRERGAPVKGQAQIQRRLAALPPCDGSSGWYHLALEAYATPADALPPSPVLDAVAGADKAVFAWDVYGKALDDAHARGLEEAARERTLADAAAREAARPQTKTLDALGLIGVLKPIGSWPGSHPAVVRDSAPGIHAEVDGVRGELVFFEKPFDLAWPAGPIAGTSCTIVPGTFVPSTVPPATRITARSWPAWFTLRQAAENPVREFRDGRTAEGEASEEQFRARFKPFERALFGLPDSFDGNPLNRYGELRIALNDDRFVIQQLFVQLGIRAYGLSPDLLWAIFEELDAEHWTSMFPSGEKSPARELLRDEEGRLLDEGELQSWQMSRASQGKPMPVVTREKLPAEMHEPLPFAWRRDQFDSFVQRATSGAISFFDLDELFEPPSPTFVARFKDFFSSDGPYLAVIEAVTKDRETITTAELESAIIEASIAKRFANAEHQRLIRLMNGAGFDKRKPVIDGKRTPAFVRRST